jgi:alpha-glucosidase (family GH31 glycosyl hydrolase)
VKQHVQETSSEPLTLRIYPGADGTMSLYQDDGITFAYQKGQFSRIVCVWNDRERILTLKTDPLGKLLRREAIVVEFAGTPGHKPLTMHNGATSIHL